MADKIDVVLKLAVWFDGGSVLGRTLCIDVGVNAVQGDGVRRLHSNLTAIIQLP
jgi:hypothetical protein